MVSVFMFLAGASAKLKRGHVKRYAVALSVYGASRSFHPTLFGALGVDHVLIKSLYLVVWNYFMPRILSKMTDLNLNSFARKLNPCVSFRLHLRSCCQNTRQLR